MLALLSDGLSTKQAARRLGVATNTINFRVRSAWQRLGLRNRAEAVAAWREMGSE